MAGGGGFWAGTAFFVALECIFWLFVQFTGSKHEDKKLKHTLYATAVVCCWLMWGLVYIAQMNPLISPVLQGLPHPAAMAKMALAAAIAALAVISPAAATRGLKQVTDLQGPSYATFPGCRFLQDLPYLSDPNFSYTMRAINQAQLMPLLSSPPMPVTVFLPNNQAFVDLVAAANITVEQLLATPTLRDTLLGHVVPRALPNTASFSQGSAPYPSGSAIPEGSGLTVPTLLAGNNVTLITENGNYTVESFGTDAAVLSGPQYACSLIAYGIDTVLLPAEDVDLANSMALSQLLTQTMLPMNPTTGPELILQAVAAGQTATVAQAVSNALGNPNTMPQDLAELFVEVFSFPSAGPAAVASVFNTLVQLNSCTYAQPLLRSFLTMVASSNSQVAIDQARMAVGSYPALSACAAQLGSILPSTGMTPVAASTSG